MLLITVIGAAVVVLALGLWFWWACALPSSPFFGPAMIRGPQQGKRVCLTFDDGPASPFTEQILEVLRKHQVPATFFVCGKNVERNPELVRRIVAEGHALGNHTYSHPYMFFKTRMRIAEEIDRTQEAIEKAAGGRPKIFRPPYGARWFGLVPTLQERGMHLIMWSATGYDWKKDVPGIVRAALEELKPGAVILLHDGQNARPASEIDRSRTVQALPRIIEGALQRGYSFAPLHNFLPLT